VLALGNNRTVQINAANQVVLTPSTGPPNSTTQLVPVPGVPIHVVVVTSPAAGKSFYTLYVNGLQDAAYNGTSSTGPLPALAASTLCLNPSPALAGAAQLDELAIWTSALDPASVTQLFNNGKKMSLRDVSNPATLFSSVYLWYTFDDTGSTMFADKGPRGRNLAHGVTVNTTPSFLANGDSLTVTPGTALTTQTWVGLGTPNPPAPLHIAHRSAASSFYNGGLLCVNSVVVRSGLSAASPGGNPWISFEQAGRAGWSLGQDVADSGKLKLVGNSSFLASNPAVTVDGTNRVGINQAAPQYALDVSGNINLTGALSLNGTPYGQAQWSSTGSSGLFYAAGNVGQSRHRQHGAGVHLGRGRVGAGRRVPDGGHIELERAERGKRVWRQRWPAVRPARAQQAGPAAGHPGHGRLGNGRRLLPVLQPRPGRDGRQLDHGTQLRQLGRGELRGRLFCGERDAHPADPDGRHLGGDRDHRAPVHAGRRREHQLCRDADERRGGGRVLPVGGRQRRPRRVLHGRESRGGDQQPHVCLGRRRDDRRDSSRRVGRGQRRDADRESSHQWDRDRLFTHCQLGIPRHSHRATGGCRYFDRTTHHHRDVVGRLSDSGQRVCRHSDRRSTSRWHADRQLGLCTDQCDGNPDGGGCCP
jgi:hypothetical protein